MRRLFGALLAVLAASGAVAQPTGTNTQPAGIAIIAGCGASNNQLLYTNAGACAGLATGNSGVLVTSSSGVPSISSTLPSGLAAPATVAATVSTDQAQGNGTASAASTLLAFASTTGIAVKQTASGTSIPLGTQVQSIVSTAQVSLTANGVSNSGQKVLTTTATTGAAVGQMCTDTTTTAALGPGNVIASIQAGVSITMTANLAASTVNSDTIKCDPVVTLTAATSAAIGSGASIQFNTNQTAVSASSNFYDLGDMSIVGNLNVGGQITSPLTLNFNAAGPPTPSANTKLQMVGVDSTQANIEMDTFGAASQFIQRSYGGTGASPSATTAGLTLGNNEFGGYDGTAIQNGARIRAVAINQWSGSDRSAFMDFATTASGSTTQTVNMELQGSGGLSVGNANISTDGGAGVIVATNLKLTTVASNTGAQSGYLCYNTNGTITYDPSSTCLVSSARFKTLERNIAPADALQIVSGLRPIVYHYKRDEWPSLPPGTQEGFFAEDVAKLDGDLVVYFPDGSPRSIKYDQMVAVLAGAIQQLKADNDDLRRRLDARQ